MLWPMEVAVKPASASSMVVVLMRSIWLIPMIAEPSKMSAPITKNICVMRIPQCASLNIRGNPRRRNTPCEVRQLPVGSVFGGGGDDLFQRSDPFHHAFHAGTPQGPHAVFDRLLSDGRFINLVACADDDLLDFAGKIEGFVNCRPSLVAVVAF